MRFLKTIKFRLTLWYVIVVAALLLVFGGVSYFMVSHNLYQNLDDSLKNREGELQTIFQASGGRGVFAGQFNEIVLIYDANGNLLESIGPNVQIQSVDTFASSVTSGAPAYATAQTSDGQQVRLYGASFTVGLLRTRIAVVVGRPVAEVTDALRILRYILLSSGLAVIILAGLGGLFLATTALRPVARITRTARAIGGSDLTGRVPVGGDDELGRLAATLNGMIERLESALNRQRQFTADASHELRTPLAVMQAETTLALAKQRSVEDYRKSLELVAQETSYMSSLIGKLLLLARSDAGKEPLSLEEVDLAALLGGLSVDAEVLAKEKGLDLKFGPMEDLIITGDKVKLRQLFLNIIDNAVRYTPEGGVVAISMTRKEGMAVTAISDTGMGIPPEHLPHIFERFYRVDKARSRAEGGAGLGLAIARYVAEVHGGKIEVQSEVGKGSTFYVSLPLSKGPVGGVGPAVGQLSGGH